MLAFVSIVLCLSAFIHSEETQNGKELRVLKESDTVYIRSRFSGNEDLVIHVGLGTHNRQVNFHGAFLVSSAAGMDVVSLNSGKQVHRVGDDACALLMNGTAIGGNHGAAVGLELVCEGHGRTLEDLGSEWKDSVGRKFYLIRIISSDKLLFMPENKPEGDVWKFERRIEGPVLKSDSRNSSINFTGKKWGVQMWPSCRIKKQEYLLDGKTPLKEGEAASCRWLDVIEEYDIIHPGSLLNDFIKHPGQERSFISDHLEAVIGYNTIFRFFPNGANVVYTRLKAYKSFNMEQFLGVMTAQLKKKDYQVHDYYIPKTLPFEVGGVKYDFRSIQDFYPPLTTPLYFTVKDNNVSDPQNPPDRFIQFLGHKEGEKTVREVGFALGYSLIHGMSVPSERVKNTERFVWIYKTSKTYPAAADTKMGNVSRGKDLYFVGYRQYFNPHFAGNATSLYWNQQENETVVYVDYHKSVEKDVIKLPAELVGKKLEVVEKTPSVTLHTESAVPAKGVEVSVTGDYGYIVMKMF